ncbi:MAG: RimK family alpha-L-glutamate ligase [Clostridia bacterium]|nr:RimK family alpha-L-glutamate ligase [Clostridia bacterium]
MKRGLILNNAYSQLKSGEYQSARLKEEFAKLGVQIDVRQNDFFAAIINGGDIECRVKDYDFCIYLDKDKYVSQMLEKCGLRLFNSHKAICDCDDKMVTAIELSNHGIQMPKTISGLLCYDENAQIKISSVEFIEKELGYPVIIKSSYGSLGKGVFKADSREELLKIMQNLKCVPHLFQQYIAESSGTDLRVIVIDGKCIAAMKRTSLTDFRSNIELGGKGENVKITAEVEDICCRVAKVLGLDYCGIDLLFGNSGCLVCEVNSNAFFGGIEGVTGINVARAYAESIYKKIY